MPAIDKIIASAVDGVKKSGTIEAGTLMATVSAVGTNGTLTASRGPDVYPSVRILSGYLKPAVGDLVEILKTNGGWVCIGKLMTSSYPQIQSGKIEAASTTANTWVDTAVTFPRPFAAIPAVVATPTSAIGSTTDLAAIVTGETTTGFTMRVRRGNTSSPTVVNWIATVL